MSNEDQDPHLLLSDQSCLANKRKSPKKYMNLLTLNKGPGETAVILTVLRHRSPAQVQRWKWRNQRPFRLRPDGRNRGNGKKSLEKCWRVNMGKWCSFEWSLILTLLLNMLFQFFYFGKAFLWPREQILVLAGFCPMKKQRSDLESSTSWTTTIYSPEVNAYSNKYRLLGMLGEEASKLTCKFLMKLNYLYSNLYIHVRMTYILSGHLQ